MLTKQHLYMQKIYIKNMEKLKEKGTYFEGSDKKYPDVDLPKWMLQIEEEE